MVADLNSAPAPHDALPALRVPSSAGEDGRGSWFQRRASRLRRSTAPVRRRAGTQDLYDVFTAEAPLTVPTPAQATGEYGADAALHARLGEWSPGAPQPETTEAPPPAFSGGRRASIDGALAPPFTTPRAAKLTRGHTLSVRTGPSERAASIAGPPTTGRWMRAACRSAQLAWGGVRVCRVG